MTNEKLINTVQQVFEYQDMLFKRFVHSLPGEVKKYIDALVTQDHLSLEDSSAVHKAINDAQSFSLNEMLKGDQNEH